jgi:hypothetical protein
MAAKHRMLVLVILLVVFLTSPIAVSASSGTFLAQSVSSEHQNDDASIIEWLTDLVTFIDSVKNGSSNELVGVFVPGVLALPVVQQPPGDLYGVSSEPGVVTQYGAAEHFGNVGLLAHNNLAGALFFNLKLGQKVTLVYGNGHSRDYTITSFRQFQATIPDSPYSNFIDLDLPGSAPVRSSDIFNLIYTGGEKVIFQTCIARDGVASWGRIFITATPQQEDLSPLQLPWMQWLEMN